MQGAHPVLKIKLQILCGDEIAMGPGKADLIEAIAAHGSISAAARAIGMSYRRAWLLVDTLNRCWKEPIVETAPGGTARAGARVTAFGKDVLGHYRALQERAGTLENAVDWTGLEPLIRVQPQARKSG